MFRALQPVFPLISGPPSCHFLPSPLPLRPLIPPLLSNSTHCPRPGRRSPFFHRARPVVIPILLYQILLTLFASTALVCDPHNTYHIPLPVAHELATPAILTTFLVVRWPPLSHSSKYPTDPFARTT